MASKPLPRAVRRDGAATFHWLEEQFHRLAGLGAGDRAEEIERLRQRLPTLTCELEALLQSELQGEGFPSGGSPAADAVTEPGQQIGPYRLEREIGRGGMGVVYEARQEAPLERRVAVKVLPGSWSPRQLERFESERLTLARLGHANVAAVYDAGTTQSGCPYLVMELVDGRPITRAADQRRASVERRLRLFCDACRGVEHAHSKGIIHRDLKPSNVLVCWTEDDPVVKIIDFGIAKDLSGAQLTVAGEALGTPAYMSPEQQSGALDSLDTRSDVYSLGVLLHELLTGRLPDGGLRRPSRDVATDGDSVATAEARGTTPERLASRLRGDLDWIVLKALAATPADRYSTVAELRADVERHLSSLPVVARPPSFRDRTLKLVRRNPLASALAASLAVALAGSLVVALVSLDRTRAAQRDAVREAAAAQRVTDLLVGLFRANLPGQAQGRELTAKEVLDRGRSEAGQKLEDSPLLKARLLRTLSEVYGNLGELASARESAAEAVETARSLDDEGRELAASLRRLGWVQRRLDQSAAAESSYREALALLERSGRDDEGVAEVLNELGLTLKLGRPQEALELLQRAREIALRTRGREDGETAVLLSNIGSLRLRLRDYDGALSAFDEALSRVLEHSGGDDPRVATLQANRASALLVLGGYAEAELALQAALDLDRRLLGGSHPSVGQDLLELARVALKSGALESAVERAEESLGILEAALGAEHSLPRVVRTLRAEVLVLQGELTAARRDLEIALAGPQDSDSQRSVATYALLTFAELHRLEEDTEAALDAARRALDSAEVIKSSLQTERAHWSRAQTLAQARRPDALAAYRTAVATASASAPGAQTALQQARFFGWWGCGQRSLDALERSIGLGLREASPRFAAAFTGVRRTRRFQSLAKALEGEFHDASGSTGPILDAPHCVGEDGAAVG